MFYDSQWLRNVKFMAFLKSKPLHFTFETHSLPYGAYIYVFGILHHFWDLQLMFNKITVLMFKFR